MNTKQRIDVCHIGKEFGKLKVVSYSHSVRYKSGSSTKFWNCLCECGTIKPIASPHLTSLKAKSCGCLRNKGGKINKDGYRFVYCKTQRKYIIEHRYLYEKYYGIKLKPNQNLHHINGDRLDNRIENLELWDTSQPKGQRVEDKIRFYFDLVNEYKDHPIYGKLIPSQNTTSFLN